MIKCNTSKMTDIDGTVLFVSLYTVEDYLVNLTFHKQYIENNKQNLKEIPASSLPNFVRERWIKRVHMNMVTPLTNNELNLYRKEKDLQLRRIKNSLKHDKELKADYKIMDVFEVAGFIALLAKEKDSDKYVLMNLSLNNKGYALDLFPSTSIDLLIVKLIPLLKAKETAYHIQINGELVVGIQKSKDIYFSQVVTAYLEVPDKVVADTTIHIKSTTSVLYKLEGKDYIPATKEKIPEKILLNMELNGTRILDEILDI